MEVTKLLGAYRKAIIALFMAIVIVLQQFIGVRVGFYNHQMVRLDADIIKIGPNELLARPKSAVIADSEQKGGPAVDYELTFSDLESGRQTKA